MCYVCFGRILPIQTKYAIAILTAMTDVTRERFLSEGVESRPVFVDSDSITARKLDRLKGFVYVRSNIPGPGSDLGQWEEDIAGCDCSRAGGNGDCGTSCPCVRLFGEAYSDRKLISNQIDGKDSMDGRRSIGNASEQNSSNCLQRPILECGSNCSCFGGGLGSAPGCANSVVGAGITFPFIVFYDERKGFGLKCSKMIPQGSFVCEYAGEVIGENEARKRFQTKRRKEKIFEGGSGGEISVDVLPEMDSNIAHRSRKGENSVKSLAVSMNYIIVLTEEIIDDAMRKADDNADDSCDFDKRSSKRRKDSRSRRTIVDAENYSNVGHFINHSCYPNLVSNSASIDGMIDSLMTQIDSLMTRID